MFFSLTSFLYNSNRANFLDKKIISLSSVFVFDSQLLLLFFFISYRTNRRDTKYDDYLIELLNLNLYFSNHKCMYSN